MGTGYEPVIGLEVHAQLLTREKIFCGCPARYGAEANLSTCPVCLGMPGVLPVLNRHAVELALRIGVALGCRINPRSVFARKHYFYPDLPKGYQITQYEIPILEGGSVTVDVGDQSRRIGVTRAHLEEDAGKSQHGESGGTLVDLNRTGVPLLEIVSEPDMRSADEATAYLKGLHEVLRYADVCDGNMEEGSFRCDANISVRPVGATALGTRTEIKNMNTFKGVHRALQYEIGRHIELIERGGAVVQETRLWDDAAGRTRAMRSKEEAHDYRYMPEPDLPHLLVDQADIDEARERLPELPRSRRCRYVEELGLSSYDAGVLTSERALTEFFDRAVAAHPSNPKALCNWTTTVLLGCLGDADIAASPVTASSLARLVSLVDDKTISGRIAKKVFEGMMAGEGTPDEIIEARGLRQVTDTRAIERAIQEVLAAHPTQVAQYRAGKVAVKGFFMGRAMRATGGRANPKLAGELIVKLLNEEASS